MASTVVKLYKTFNALCGPRLTYGNGVETCKAGDTLYAFSYTVSNSARSLRIGPILELSVVEIQIGYQKYKAAFRRKKDYSLFKKPCHMYRYNMYRTKEDAEAAYKAVTEFFLKEIQNEIICLENLHTIIEKQKI